MTTTEDLLFELQTNARSGDTVAIDVLRAQTGANSKTKPVKPTDDELAARYLAVHSDIAYGMGEWRRYQNGVWPVIEENEIRRDVTEILKAAKSEGIRPTDGLLSSVIRFVRDGVEVSKDKWDGNPDILVCKNGALHIPSGQLQPHSLHHYATFRLNFDYDPQAEAPFWQYALSSTIPDAKDFIQEFAGYCVTTDTSHEIAIWLVGPAGSGKSTVQEGLQSFMGERVTNLGLADIERSRFALGDLRGKTLAMASEQPAIYMQASWLLNKIISGETITTERKFKDPISFRPMVKILWAMNEMPRVPDAGNGLFRRVKVIKFPALEESKRDPDVKEAIKLEGAGILNWALKGLQRLRARGRFDIPACVKDATTDFQTNNDIPSLFVQECCLTGADLKTQSQLLYDSYKEWCLKTGHKAMSSTTIAPEWDRLGFTKYMSNGKVYWKGVTIRE